MLHTCIRIFDVTDTVEIFFENIQTFVIPDIPVRSQTDSSSIQSEEGLQACASADTLQFFSVCCFSVRVVVPGVHVRRRPVRGERDLRDHRQPLRPVQLRPGQPGVGADLASPTSSGSFCSIAGSPSCAGRLVFVFLITSATVAACFACRRRWRTRPAPACSAATAA